MLDDTRLSRRSLAALFAAAAAAPAPARQSPAAAQTPEVADAAAALKRNVEAIADVRVERQVEPSFRFEA